MTTFYWQHARDSVLTPTALRIFQIASAHNGEAFATATEEIDAEYKTVVGRSLSRHGGLFQTHAQAFREAGWIDLSGDLLTITPAGLQALELMGRAPDFLKAVPWFVVELLSRYQLNNPAKPPVRNAEIAELVGTSDVFPYWTLWKIMRGCSNRLTTEELRRFVLQLHDSDAINGTIAAIKQFRADKLAGLDDAQMAAKYPAPLEGAVGESKYIMGRAGAQIGRYPPLITKPQNDTYELNPAYFSLIDDVLANEPVFKDDLSAASWLADYGRAVELSEEDIYFVPDASELEMEPLDATDPILLQIQDLITDGHKAFMLSGPPGTSKTWYAQRIAMVLAGGDPARVKTIQFHQSFSYEDFIEGFVPVTSPRSTPTFELKPKVFLQAAALARHSDSVVLVIDEFTRGDAGRIFGEVLTYLETDYRDVPFLLSSGRTFAVPKNLYIIATMNPFDRSVVDVDSAMLRRFAVIEMNPDESILRSMLHDNELDAELLERVVAFFKECQLRLPQGGLGHVYFQHARDMLSLERIWKYQLLPLFRRQFLYEPDELEALRVAFGQVLAQGVEL